MALYRGVGIRKAVLAWGVADWLAMGTGLASLGFTRIPRLSVEFDTEALVRVGITSFKLFKLLLYFVINYDRIISHLLFDSAAKYLTR